MEEIEKMEERDISPEDYLNLAAILKTEALSFIDKADEENEDAVDSSYFHIVDKLMDYKEFLDLADFYHITTLIDDFDISWGQALTEASNFLERIVRKKV